jgi:sigma-B regulation protein RsbU (phosphoserine phosphatase)
MATYFFLATSLFEKDKLAYVFSENRNLSNSIANNVRSSVEKSLGTIRALISTATTSRRSAVKTTLDTMFDSDAALVSLMVFKTKSVERNGKLTNKNLWFSLHDKKFLKPYKLKSSSYRTVTKSFETKIDQTLLSSIVVGNTNIAGKVPVLSILVRMQGSTDVIALALLRTDGIAQSFRWNSLRQSYLVDYEGSVILGPAGKTTSDKLSSWVSRSVKGGFTDKSIATLDGEGREVIASFSQLGLANLGVLTLTDQELALIASKRFFWRSILYGLLIVFIATVVSVLSTNQITRSLRLLYQATKKVAKGDFDIEVPVQTKDEIGALSHSFGKMSSKIRDLIKETDQKARIDQELETARNLQQMFTSDENIENDAVCLSGCIRTADQCGGDWWGYFPLSDDQHLFIVGDATGHGVPAALVTAIVHSASAMQARGTGNQNLEPAKFVDSLNKLVCETLKGELAMTLFAATFDAKTGKIRFANAGHNFPLLIPKDPADPRLSRRRKARKFVYLTMAGAPLGIDIEATFEEGEIETKPGDRLILFTDGLIEHGPDAGNQWGKRGMSEALTTGHHLSPKDLRDHLLSKSLEYGGEAPLEDDVTLVVLDLMMQTMEKSHPKAV